jgi:hypothetical protein
MKLTKLSAAWLPESTCRLMPAPPRLDAGTASQLIPGVSPTDNRTTMGNQIPNDRLSVQAPDYVVLAAKAALGAVPFAGSLLSEIAGSIIPNQRIDRIVSFARELEARLSDVDQRFVRSQLTNENFTDLIEEALRQVARSVSQERRAHIAALIVNGLKPDDVSFIESKHLLRILGEINDIEVIRLVSHLYETMGSGEDYWNKHRDVLEPVAPAFGSSQREIDKGTLQDSYDEHLAQLGLLSARHNVDSRTNQLVVDRFTGALEVRGYAITSLGRLLLKQVGAEVEDAG